jgi:hypothetical protein
MSPDVAKFGPLSAVHAFEPAVSESEVQMRLGP